jgi:hypothetical protein
MQDLPANARSEDLQNVTHSSVEPMDSDRRAACAFIRDLGVDLDLPITCVCNALALWHAVRAAPTARSNFEVLSPALKQKKDDATWIDQWRVDCAACVLVSVKAHEVQRKVTAHHPHAISVLRDGREGPRYE